MILLQVSRNNGATWGTLQKFNYDDANRFQTRKAAMAHAVKARMRWADNYVQFRDATFRIVDSADMSKGHKRKPVPAAKPAVAPTDNWPEGVSVMTLDKDNFNPAALYSFVGKAIGGL